jgi:hypothetical protein
VTSAWSRSDIAFEIFCVINVSFKSHLEEDHTKYFKGNVASRPGRGHRTWVFSEDGGRRTAVGGRWSTDGGSFGAWKSTDGGSFGAWKSKNFMFEFRDCVWILRVKKSVWKDRAYNNL